jgi:hypothetical protein
MGRFISVGRAVWARCESLKRAQVVASVFPLVLASVSPALGARPVRAGSGSGVTYDSIVYVSPFGSDSNDGSSWQAAKATLGSALSALPNCTAIDVKGISWTLPCGQIEVDAGTLSIGSPVTISSPLISIIGRGSASTQFTWNGSGCAITVDTGSGGVTFPGPTFQGFSIDGSGDTNADSCGLHYEDSSHAVLRDMTISGFTASGDSCLYATPGATVAERVALEHLFLGNCNVGWLLQNTGSSFRTFGYGNFDVYINLKASQTGIKSLGNGPSAELRLKFSVFHVIVNSDSSDSTCATLSNYSHWADDTGVFRCDGPSQGFHVDGTSYLFFGGDLDSDGGLAVADGGHLVIQETAQDLTTGHDALQEWEAATASNPGTGPSWGMMGQYWNGSGSLPDVWKFQQVPSQDSSDLVVQHVSGPPDAHFAAPTLEILASPGGYGGYASTLSAPGGAYYQNTLPAASGTLALAGANGISAGTITLSSGSGLHVFSKPYQSTPVCTVTDTTSQAPVKVTSTSTTVYVIGMGDDVVAWICTPAAN